MKLHIELFMRKVFWEIAARLGFWIPCRKHLPDRRRWDWVLISKIERNGGFRGIPEVGEFNHATLKWHTAETDENPAYANYFHKHCSVTHWHRLPMHIK